MDVSLPRFAIVAHGRTGTNFLRSMLNDNAGVYCFGEVFFPGEHAYGFMNFLRIQQQRNPDLYLPHNWHEILPDYFKELYDIQRDGGYDHVGFDLKIAQIETIPQAYNFLRRVGYGIIHLRRIHVPLAILSLHRLSLTVSRDIKTHVDFKHPRHEIDVDINALRHSIALQEHGDQLARIWLEGPSYVEIFYEDLLHPIGQHLTEQKLSTLFGRTIALSDKSRLMKQSDEDPRAGINAMQEEVHQVIANYDAKVVARRVYLESMATVEHPAAEVALPPRVPVAAAVETDAAELAGGGTSGSAAPAIPTSTIEGPATSDAVEGAAAMTSELPSLIATQPRPPDGSPANAVEHPEEGGDGLAPASAGVEDLRARVLQKQVELRSAIEALGTATGEHFTPWAPHLAEAQLATCRVLPSRYHILQYMPREAICAEVGSQAGNFARQIIAQTQPEKLHILDLDLGQFQRDGLEGEIASGRIKLHEGNSPDLLAAFPDAHFDWIYIDGDHSYEGVSKDLAIASRKLKPNGFIVCNDYTFWSPAEVFSYGIPRAVHELCVNDNWEFVFIGLQGQGYHDVCIRKRAGKTPPR